MGRPAWIDNGHRQSGTLRGPFISRHAIMLGNIVRNPNPPFRNRFEFLKIIRRTTVVLFVVLTALIGGAASSEEVSQGPVLLEWEELPELPDPIGFAAPFSGVSGNALIVAGGANFPDGPPWKGGRKVWHDRIFFLPASDPSSDSEPSWRLADRRLPRINAYGVNLGIHDAVICLGGCGQKWNEQKKAFDFQECYDKVFVLRRSGDEIEIGDKLVGPKDDPANVLPIPDLPRPLAFMAGCLIENQIYLVGGQEQLAGGKATNNFWRLDLSKRDEAEKFRWEELPWPEGAPPRVLPVVAAQSDGRETCLFMFSGRDDSGDSVNLLTDAWKFDPKKI